MTNGEAAEEAGRTARFGVFEADLRTGELRKAGRQMRLQDQPFRVLAALLENPGELVTRQELQTKVWPDDTLIDFDHALTTAVKKLRRTLQDSPSQPRYIETLPRKGYRFIAPVEIVPGTHEAVTNGNGGVRGELIGDVPAAPLRRLRIQRDLLIGLVGLLMLAAGTLIFASREETAPAADVPVRRFSFTPEWSGFRSRPNQKISPNGRHIVYVDSGEPSSLWIRDLDSEEPYRLEGTEGANEPFWSPDSEFIGFGTADLLKKVSIHGGGPLTICRLAERMHVGGAWSRDGRTMVFSTGMPASLYQVSADGGDPKLFFDPVATPNGGANYDISFLPPSPAGRGVLFAAGGPAGREIVVMNLDDGVYELIGEGSQPVYADPGYILYQAPGQDGGIWAVPFSLERLEVTGPAQPIVAGAFEPSLSNDGTLVYGDRVTRSEQHQLILKDRTGTRLQTVGRPQDLIRSPLFSPDGRGVAVSGTEGGEYDIWVHSVRAPTKTRVTYDPVVEGDPVWSADGQEIVYRADPTAETELRRIHVDRRSPPTTVPAKGFAKRSTAWTEDGRHIVYAAYDYSTQSDLWLLPLAADGAPGEPRAIMRTPFNEVAGRISPDGRYLAYCSDETGDYEVYIATFPDAEERWQASLGGGCQPRWSQETEELFYVDGDTLLVVETTGKDYFGAVGSKPLFRDPNLVALTPHRSTYDVSPDGQSFVLRETVPLPDVKPPSIHVVQNWWGAFRWPLTETDD